MKWGLIVFIVAMIGGAFTLSLVQADSGYVLIALGNTSVEMSFWLALLVLLGAMALIGLALGLLKGVFSVGRNASARLFRNSSARAQRRTASGLVDFIEGNWKQAQRKLLRAADKADTPMINYLAAARSAYEMGERTTALELLHKAEQSSPNSELAVALTQARMQLMSRRYEQCLATLERVKRKAPQHPVVLELLRQVYVALGDWQSLRDLLPSLRAYGTLSDEQLDALAKQLHSALLKKAGERAQGQKPDEARDTLHKTWKEVPAPLRKNPAIAGRYAQQLLDNQLNEEAENLVRKTLEKHWDPELVKLYGLIAAHDSRQQLLHAETWLKKRPGDALLMLSLGRLSLRNELWGRARDYFYNSLQLQQLPETCAELARLLAHMGEHKKSTEYYQQGLLLITDALPSLPLPGGKDGTTS